jgi:sigma-B regulation protein RsbU (phosphoserine phosphatase)
VAVHYSAGLWPGGSYYDVLPLPDGRVLFLIADASDQGAASTALAIIVRVVLHSCPLSSGASRVPFCPFSSPSSQPPDVLLGHLNHVLSENKLEEQFVTAFCGVLDPANGSFHYANAGHPYPRWWRAAHGRVESVRGATGPPLGTAPHAMYPPESLLIDPGDLLVLHSDGLTAALNAKSQMFGWQQVDDTVCEAAPSGAEAVKSAVVARLESFLATAADQEEVALLVIERQKESGSPES